MLFRHSLVLALAGVAFAYTMGPQILEARKADAAAALTQDYYPPTAECWEYSVPVKVPSVEVTTFSFSKWNDDFALQDFLSTVTTRPSANLPGPYAGKANLTDLEYTIAASFCTPKNQENRKKTVILATHGIGLTRSHWNPAYEPENYSFLQHAISQGYSVWFYDRLGCGKSTKVSGFTNQLRIQKAVLAQLASIVKSGNYNGDFGVPEKLVLLGFSYGSFITHFTVAENPKIADGVLLSGINYNLSGINANGLTRSFVPRIASLQNPTRFGVLDPGYLSWNDILAQINTYFKYPFFDIPTVLYNEANKAPFAIGEFLTLTDGEFDASGFTGVSLAIAGQTDYIVCDGYCPGLDPEPANTIWKNAKNFTTYYHPDASHNFYFHFNATGAFKVMTDFLIDNKV